MNKNKYALEVNEEKETKFRDSMKKLMDININKWTVKDKWTDRYLYKWTAKHK